MGKGYGGVSVCLWVVALCFVGVLGKGGDVWCGCEISVIFALRGDVRMGGMVGGFELNRLS